MTTADGLQFLRELVRKRSAIVLEEDKAYLLESRLSTIVRDQGYAGLDQLIHQLRRDENGPLTRKVVEAMTTNETSFFRDVHPWETLRHHILPALIKARQKTRRLRIWCAAASTGQEPYTIAMVVQEYFPELASWDVEIIGTDINIAVLDRARGGIYRQLEINRGLPAPMMVKYFERRGTEWQVKPELKRLVLFQELNLLDRWTLVSMNDVVFMRNVLIYFDLPVKRDILARVRDKLAPDGFLFLGGAETTLNLDEQFVPMRAGGSVVYHHRTHEPK